MALDPKQVLLENKALVGCYVAALAAVVAQFVLVMPMTGYTKDRKVKRLAAKGKSPTYGNAVKQIASIKTKLKTLIGKVNKKELYTAKDVAAFKERKQKLTEKVSKLGGLYVEADKTLEVWFPELGLSKMEAKKGGYPDMGRFSEVYKSQFDKLTKKYVPIAGAIGESILKKKDISKTANGTGQIKAQKIFWIEEALLEAMTKAKVSKLQTDIDISSDNIPADEEPEISYFTCRFTVATSFRDLPKLVQSILSARLLFQIRDFTVNRTDFGHKLDTPLIIVNPNPRKFFEKSIYVAKFPDGVNEFKGSEEELIPEPTIQVTMRVLALDFKNAPPPKKEGEKEE